jgi:hypothetical protein
LRPLFEQFQGLLELGEGRQDEEAGVGVALADRTGRREALGGVLRRHSDVDDREVGVLGGDQFQQPYGVVGLAHHAVSDPLAQAVCLGQECTAVGHQVLSGLGQHASMRGNSGP